MPKDIPASFHLDSEEDVRLLVAQYFQDVGFELDELSAEDSFAIHLGHTDIVVGAKRDRAVATARSDLLLMRHGHPIMVVELKAPNVNLTPDHARQAISYARLLAEIAPYALVTNGTETRIYDVFAADAEPVPLNSPAEAKWHQAGGRVPDIGEDLRYEAARTLIGLNADTLQDFCHAQLARTLEDLRGSVATNRIYIPDVYTPRPDISSAISAWLLSEEPCFALVGPSGLGKTNELCARAEQLVSEHFVLFYRARHLPSEGLLEAIRRDFAWEFQRDRDPSHVIARFDDLAHAHGKRFLIVVDGLDEFPGQHENLKSELLDLAQRLRRSAVRLLLSCKDYEWPEYVIDQAQSYNTFARSVYPQRAEVRQPTHPTLPDERKVGHWITQFGDTEEDSAFSKYAQAYTLRGHLDGALRIECQVPLMMRLVAETYSGRSHGLPSVITSRDLYRRFWARAMGRVGRDTRTEAQQFLAALARCSIEGNHVEVPLLDIAQDMGIASRIDALCDQVAQAGIVQETADEYGAKYVSFRFRKIAAYAYLMLAERWAKQPVEKAAEAICRLMHTPTGTETIEMYLTVFDEGRTDVLTKVAERDLSSFIALMGELQLHSRIGEHPEDSQRDDLPAKRIEHYVAGYSTIARRYFGQLADRLVPYASGEVGGLFYGNDAFQLRIRTSACPEPLVAVDPQWMGLAMRQGLPPAVVADLRPGGPIHLGDWAITNTLPEKIAWDEIEGQLGTLFMNRTLDETEAPFLLRERAWRLLLNEHPMLIDGLGAGSSYMETIGFSSADEIATCTITDVQKHILDTVRRITVQAEKGIAVHQCNLMLKNLGYLYYALDSLAVGAEHLEPLPYTRDRLFSYLNSGNRTETVEALRTLIPQVLTAHHALIERNLIDIANHLPFYRYRHRPIVVEVAQAVSDHARGFRLSVAYIALPTAELPDAVTVFETGAKSVLADIPFIRETLRGHAESRGSWGARFGYGPVHLTVAGRQIDEPSAAICFLSYPTDCTVLDQSYQLLGHEVQYALQGSSHGWSNLEYGKLDNPAAERLALHQLIQRLARNNG